MKQIEKKGRKMALTSSATKHQNYCSISMEHYLDNELNFETLKPLKILFLNICCLAPQSYSINFCNPNQKKNDPYVYGEEKNLMESDSKSRW